MKENKLCQNCISREDKTNKIIAIEWAMFDQVNKGKSRASCQEDPDTFVLMRRSQFDAWSEELLDSGCIDLEGYGADLLEEAGYVLTADESAYITRNNLEFLRDWSAPEEAGLSMEQQ